jgi:NADH-ubiquinone oxidoreductase chain 4
MGLVILGLFSFNIIGLEGSIILMLSHGLVSSGLFICIGFLYDRYNTRLLKYYKGLVYFMPIYSILFFIFILANISFPGTSSFVGEFLIFNGIFQKNIFIMFIISISILINTIYSF